jgi:hypothetical protein
MPRYDPETLMLLRTALDEAWALLPDYRKSGTQKSEMAQRILKQAAEGVRDPIRLRAAALIGAVDGPIQTAEGHRGSAPAEETAPVPNTHVAGAHRAAGGGCESRTFECPKCELTETRMADDPLKSGAVARLAAGLRPPS